MKGLPASIRHPDMGIRNWPTRELRYAGWVPPRGRAGSPAPRAILATGRQMHAPRPPQAHAHAHVRRWHA
eukprot:15295786-Alexandrium_andersonii.AAC.1